MKVDDATIPMHPHPWDEKSFFCYCARFHYWGERGTHTFRLPGERHRNFGYRMIRCGWGEPGCGIWHIQPLSADRAENLIHEEKEAI